MIEVDTVFLEVCVAGESEEVKHLGSEPFIRELAWTPSPHDDSCESTA